MINRVIISGTPKPKNYFISNIPRTQFKYVDFVIGTHNGNKDKIVYVNARAYGDVETEIYMNREKYENKLVMYFGELMPDYKNRRSIFVVNEMPQILATLDE